MSKIAKINPIYSLKFQLCMGAFALLAVTLTGVSYFLIGHQKRILTHDLQQSVVFQGRNVALSSAKALLRADPEFELIPLVTRISESSKYITSLLITDADQMIVGDLELQNIGEPFEPQPSGTLVRTDLVEDGESLYGDASSFTFVTPVRSLGKTIGYIHMVYSKRELIDAIRSAMTITLVCGAVTFLLGIILALVFFQRISDPLDIVVKGVNSLGKGNLNTRINLSTRNEFRFLAESFNTMASTLHEAQSELLDKHLVDHELEIAHDIQNTLIPDNIQQPEGYEIGIHYEAATQVGGDYVDVIPIDSNHVALAMADVSGKGIPGLVIMAMLKIMTFELVRKGNRPKDVIRSLNTSLAMNIRKNMFVTMFLGILNLKTGELVFSNAAHNPILIYDQPTGRSEFRRITGRPLALFSDDVFCERLTEDQITIPDGGLFLVYTDGLNESHDTSQGQFGHGRVKDLCDLHAREGAQTLVKRLVQSEVAFRGDLPQKDDLTLLAVRSTAFRFATEPIGGRG